MSTQNWITLMEYSAKHRVSLSTLRRRIKAGEIENKFQDGKYLLLDNPVANSTRPSSESIAPPTSIGAPNSASPIQPAAAQQPAGVDPDQYFKMTQGLLSEIKKAYTQVLHEKEEQIIILRNEVADLKTLVRVLEDENERMQNLSKPNLDLDLGLEV